MTTSFTLVEDLLADKTRSIVMPTCCQGTPSIVSGIPAAATRTSGVVAYPKDEEEEEKVSLREDAETDEEAETREAVDGYAE
jgi:hypothetical protein